MGDSEDNVRRLGDIWIISAYDMDRHDFYGAMSHQVYEEMPDIGFVWVEWPYARIRRELDVDNGTVTRFVYQLEYNVQATEDGLPPNDWREVARFDHDRSGQHDITEEGLHLDVYRDGEKYETTRDFPPVPLNQAPAFCMAYLQQNADYFIDRFERWHDVGERWGS